MKWYPNYLKIYPFRIFPAIRYTIIYSHNSIKIIVAMYV